MDGKSSRPTFLWQGLPILLPVGIMAIIALIAIARDRAAVEQDTGRRAEEIARQLQSRLEQEWASELTPLNALSSSWLMDLWQREQWPGEGPKGALSHQDVIDWQNKYPGLALSNCVPNYVDFTADGEIHYPQPDNFPPKPSPVWAGLSPTQREAWQKLESTQLIHTPAAGVEEAVKSFLATKPPAETVVNAQFLALRSRLPKMKAAEAVDAAVAFIQSHSLSSQSESGIPLAALLLNDALARSRDIGPSKRLWDGIQNMTHIPGFMAARLLTTVSEIVREDPQLKPGIDAWREQWNAQNNLRELAREIQKTGVIDGLITTNFWMTHGSDRWFCVTTPTWIHPEGSISNQVTTVYLYPGTLVASTLQGSLRDSHINIPDYLNATIELAGRHFTTTGEGGIADSGRIRHFSEAPILLAQVPGKLTQTIHRAPEVAANGSLVAAGVDYEGMPGNPAFNVRVMLTNRTAMLAQHRMRALLLDGIIIASAFAAVAGFLAARRGFLRQIGLNEMKSNFVSSVSHELRAPIASVRLMAESLERGKVADGEKQNEYYRFIVQECRRLSSLIENVLDFSRIEQGRKQYEFEPTDVLALTRETVKLMEPYAEEKGVKLETSNLEHQTSNIELEVDGRAIQQALVNLIDNAIKHSARGQTVTVGMDSNERRSGVPPVSHFSEQESSPKTGEMPVLLFVEDRGAGIPPGEHEKIFERFYRLGSELRRETQGVGIGLSIVRHIVEAHGGQVTVRSNIGEGSRFTIILARSAANTQNDGGTKEL